MKNNSIEAKSGIGQLSSLTKGSLWLLIIGIILISSITRAPITAVGPVIAEISLSAGLSKAMAGLLTTLPLIAFGFFSPLAPIIAKKIGMEQTLLASLVILMAAIVLRSFNSVIALFAGTFLIGAAIAAANVLLPSLIKRDFRSGVGLMMGILSVVITLGAAIGSGIAIPMVEQAGFSWRGMLASWAVLAMLAFIVWLPVTLASKKKQAQVMGKKSRGSKLWRSMLAWQVTVFLGLQSLTFYVNVSWLPEILHDQGMSLEQAGYMVSILQLVGIPLSFIIPIIAGRFNNQRFLSLASAVALGVGYLGLLLSPGSFVMLWIILVGLGGSAGFALALMFFVLRTDSAQLSAELSGMAQTFGYFLAAVGPLAFGALYDMTGTWSAGLIMLLVVVALFAVSAWGAADNKVISD